MEIDLTRSHIRLLQHPELIASAYHALIYLPDEKPYVVRMPYLKPLRRVAVPLRGEVVAMDLQPAYDHAYQAARIAGHILKHDDYADDALPFPTILTRTQRQSALEKVATWRAELEHLKLETAQ